MNMRKYENTKLTVEHIDNKMTWEGNWDADLDAIMEGFVGCLRGIGFGDWVIESIKDWCMEQLPEELEEKQ